MIKWRLELFQDWEFHGFLCAAHIGFAGWMWYNFRNNRDRGISGIYLVNRTIDLSVPYNGTGMPPIDFSMNREITEFNLWLMNAIFLTWTALFHLMYFVQKLLFPQMKKSLSLYLRWLEYFSASIMIAIIMILTGMRDIYTIVAFMALMWVTMDYGMAEEFIYENNLQPDVPFWISPGLKGGFPFMVVWISLFVEFNRAIDENGGDNVPDFVRYIIWTLFVFYCSFWAVQVWFLKLRYFIMKVPYPTRGSDEIYLNMRRMDAVYHILSLLSKLMLAVFVGLGLNGVLT